MPEDIREFLKRRRAGQQQAAQPAQPGDIRSFVAARRAKPATPPPEPPGFFENLWIGARQGYQDYIEAPVYALAEAGQAAARGDFQPARQVAELAGRGALKLASAFDPVNAEQTYAAVSAEQDPRIAAVQAEQNRRRVNNPAFVDQLIERSRLGERAALDPSRTGRITRGAASLAVGAAPAIATGAVTGGTAPAMIVAGLQSAGQPENTALNVLSVPAMGAAGQAAGRVVAPALRRIRGALQPAGEVPAAGEIQVGTTGRRVDVSTTESANAQLAPTRAALEQQSVSPTGRVVNVGGKQYTLTPEQEARWLTEIDQATVDAKRYAGQWTNTDPQQAAKVLKGRMMEISKTKREIVGALTEKEQAAAAARQASNYRGKPVTVMTDKGPANGTVESNVFGRVKVKLDNGALVTVEPGAVTPLSGQPAALRSAFQKLGTQDLEEIGNIIESANKRYRGESTPFEIQEAQADYELLRRLTPDEQRALGAVLPARPFNPVVEGYKAGQAGSYSRPIENIPAGQPNAQLDANLRELEDFFGQAAREGIESGAGNRAGLARAIGESADDVSNIMVRELGLPTAPQVMRSAGAKPAQRSIPIGDITLTRDSLSRGRLFQVQEALEEGIKPGGATYLTPKGSTRVVDAMEVVPDPANPGKWLIENDGNHRAALLKLSGYSGEVPVTAWETPAQAKVQEAAIRAASARSASASVTGPAAPSANLTVGASSGSGGGASSGGPGGGTGGTGGTGGGASAAAAAPATAPTVPATPAARTHWLEVLSAFRKAGLLTSPKTHIKNIGGNLASIGLDEVSRIPASLVDAIVGSFRKTRTITGPSPAAIARSGYEAATKGVGEAWQVIRRGYSQQQAARLQIPTEINSGSKIIDFYVNGVFRTLGAEDQVFYTYAFRRSLEDRAKSLALTELKQGTLPRSGYGARIRSLSRNPTPELEAQAIADAEAATFTESNKLAEGFSRFKEAQGPVTKFGLDLIFPFVKTPTNVIKRMLEYTPAGGAYSSGRAVAKALQGAFTDAEQRAFSQGIGRAATGTALIYLGYRMYEKGIATGFLEDDLTRRARDLAAGRLPGAVKINGTWLQVAGFAPGGNLIALGATLAREWKQDREKAEEEEGTPASFPAVSAAALLQAASEQPLVSGSEQIADLFKQPEQAASKLAGGILGSFVPTIVSNAGEAIDPAQREAKTITERVLNRIPGARQTLPQAIDVIGQPRPGAGPVGSFFDPTRATTDQASQNPVFAELVRLDQGISGFQQKKSETPEAYRTKVQSFGNLYARFGAQLISSQPYGGLTDEDRREAFAILNSRAKTLVTQDKARFAALQLNPGAIILEVRDRRLKERMERARQSAR